MKNELPSRQQRRSFDRMWNRALNHNPRLDKVALDALHGELLSMVSAWKGPENGLSDLRTTIMNDMDRSLLYGVFLTLEPGIREKIRMRIPELPQRDEEVERHLKAMDLRISVLRAWGMRWYLDRGSHGWFEVYRQAVHLRHDAVRRDLIRLSGESAGPIHDFRDSASRALNTALRLRLLQLPPGASIDTLNRPRRLNSFPRRLYHALLSRFRNAHD